MWPVVAYHGPMVWILVLVLLLLLLVALVPVMLVLLGAAPAVDEFETEEPAEEPAERRSRQAALAPIENALLQRRVDLDARRGMLGGDSDLLEELDELERRRAAGGISEADFEAEKVRLLGG